MKYKCIYYNTSGSQDVDRAANFSFYRKSEAIASMNSWIQRSPASHQGYIWDGTEWVWYYNVP